MYFFPLDWTKQKSVVQYVDVIRFKMLITNQFMSSYSVLWILTAKLYEKYKLEEKNVFHYGRCFVIGTKYRYAS